MNASDPSQKPTTSVDLVSAYPHIMGNASSRTIAALCTRSHLIAKEKGWLEEERSVACHMLLFISEVSEGFEDYRANKRVDEIYWEGSKPCGIPIELADVVIRVCQYAGTEGIADDVSKDTGGIEKVNTAGESGDLETFLADLCTHFVDYRDLMAGDNRAHAAEELRDAVVECFEFAALFGIDLWAAIEVKEEYNRTRPTRHGGKRC